MQVCNEKSLYFLVKITDQENYNGESRLVVYGDSCCVHWM
jgi:hypothetical protein